MSEPAEEFWTRVNTLIKSNGTKQQSISEQCGISYQTFRGWVTRKVFPDALQTVKIAQCLNATVEYLVAGKQPQITRQDVLNYIKDNLN